jgi:hypothetical protein
MHGLNILWLVMHNRANIRSMLETKKILFPAIIAQKEAS